MADYEKPRCEEPVPIGTINYKTGAPHVNKGSWVCSLPHDHRGIHKAYYSHAYDRKDKFVYEWPADYVIDEQEDPWSL